MSTSWREAILKQFRSEEHPLTLVADPDNLLADELVLAELQERGFAVEVYEDPIAFRYLYESTYRPPTAENEADDLIVLVRDGRHALDDLPYDLLQRGRQLDFSLTNLFPHLNHNVVAALDNRELDKLFSTQQAGQTEPLGENATKDYVLHHVYNLRVSQLGSDADILGHLLALHVSGRQLPPMLAERLVSELNRTKGFADWPLLELFTDDNVLLSFLQERWPVFLDQLAAEGRGAGGESTVHDALAANEYMLRWSGQPLLPFDVPTIQAFVDTLFLERKLRPVKHPQANRLREKWVAVGLQSETEKDRQQELEQLAEELRKKVPPTEARYQDWMQFARSWAELALLKQQAKGGTQRYESLQLEVDSAFQDWLSRRYHNLATLPPHPPIMVHHIARSLARELRADISERVALVVIDGLALDQWLIVRDALQAKLSDLQFSESAVFAWIPTITSLSRQALFAGKVPASFPDTVMTTAKEPTLWSSFWADEGLDRGTVGYAKGLRHSEDLTRVESLVSQARMRAVGLVINQVDEMMHGEKLGTKGLHNSIRLWLDDGFLAELLNMLLNHHFQVVITADHGNIEAQGAGSPKEQALAISRGSRARIYPNDTLRSKVQVEFPGTLLWPTTSLPPGYWPLLAPNRTAFAPDGSQLVTHGGATLEEVLVPYIRIQTRNDS